MAIVADKSTNNPTYSSYSTANRTAATTAAVMALTPLYAGEIARALDTGQRYRGTALSAGAWALMHGSL